MSKYFKSYLGHSENDIKLKKSTFTSYLEEELEGDNSIEVEQNASAFFLADLRPRKLPGEESIAEVDRALKYTSYTDRKKGISGSLFVTNFKVSFITSDRSSYTEQSKHQRNLLLEECDIPLTNIDSVYQIFGGKKKKVTIGSVSSDSKLLQIYCKDLQVHTFGFSSKQECKKFAYAISQHTFPVKPTLLFAFEYGKNIKKEDLNTPDIPLFDNRSNWEAELCRQGCSNSWWVTDVNRNFVICTSLPHYFVVPTKLLNGDLCKAAPHFVNSRLPTWCYTHNNGRSLVRMANLLPQACTTEQEESQNTAGKLVRSLSIRTQAKNKIEENSEMCRLLNAMQKADNSLLSPAVLDTAKLCPSLKDVQTSFGKLKELCFIDTNKEFAIQDLDWYSALENTQWLYLVLQYLTACSHVISILVKGKQTVVLQEHDSRNMSCVVSSLVQLSLDPFFRTRNGFEALIQREWVMLGHPFQTNLAFVKARDDVEQVPLFLLFLDSVWQLMQQFPACFAFSETYLTTLWDSVHIGLFDTFLFDSYYEKTRFWSSGNCLKRCRLPSLWNWNLLFCDEDVLLFNNPLYIMAHEPVWTKTLKGAIKMQISTNSQNLRDEMYARNLGQLYTCEEDMKLVPVELNPEITAPLIRLWSQCYLRWQVPAQIMAGGNPSQYLQQCLLVDEVVDLQHKIDMLEQKTHRSRPKSGLIFGHAFDTPQASDLLRSKYLSSSFPFSSNQTSSDNHQLIQTPLIVYLLNSTIDYDYDDCAD